MSAEDATRAARPTPWHVEMDREEDRGLVIDAEGGIVMEIEPDEPGEAPDLSVARRICEAMNAYESIGQGRPAEVSAPPIETSEIGHA